MRADDPITAAVFDFVAQFERDVERGEVHDLAYYLARFPGHEDAIRAEHVALAELHRGPAPSQGAAASPLGRRVGPYELLAELGRGGQGTVYLARDSRLKREVALKVLPPAMFVGPARLKRFRREADIVASLSHPGICDVIDADFAGEVAYIAMRFVPGRPLADEIRGLPPPDRRGIRRAILLIERAARALHVAHEAGVVHRDIKPANILVTPAGEPVLLDFGLAREVGDGSLTEPGVLFGTLDYMAPEQLAEEPRPLDRRTDVYALAASLYEMVTGTRPFVAASREALAHRILTDQPRDPRAIHAHVPADLGVVLLAALEKDPARRYATALAFAADLRRIVDDEPILARPAGPWLRLRRWARRHRILATSIVLAGTLLTAGLAVTLILLDAVVRERERYRAIFYATHARKLVEQDPGFALLTAVESARIAPSFVANTALYEILDVCREELRIAPDVRPETAVLSASAGHVATVDAAGRCMVEALVPGGPPPWVVPMRVRSVAFDPEGQRVVTGGEDGAVAVFDARSGAQVAALPGLAGPVTLVAVGPEARLVAAASAGETRLFGAGAGTAAGRVLLAGRAATAAAVSADGARVVTLAGGVLTAQAVAPAAEPVVLGEGTPVHAFALAATGTLCAVAIRTEVHVADLATSTVVHRFATHRPAPALAFDPAGERLAACERGRFTVWSMATGATLVDQEAHRNQILWDIAWSPDGEWLATAGLDSASRVYASRDGALACELPLLGAHPRAVRFAAAGPRLVASASNGQVIVYRLDDRPGQRTLRGQGGSVRSARFSPDGSRIASASDDGTARVFDRTGNLLHACDLGGGPLAGLRWSADGRSLAAVSSAGSAHVWQLTAPGSVALAAAPASDAFFDAAGCVAVLARDGRCERFLPSGARAQPEGPAAATPDGATAAAATANGGELRVQAVALDGARRRLAIGYGQPRVDVVDLAPSGARAMPGSFTFATQNLAIPRPQVMVVQFSPSGRYLAVGGQDTFVHLLEASTLRSLGSMGRSTPGCIAFDPSDSHVLIGGMFNPQVVVCSAGAGGLRHRTVLADHRDRITAVDFHRDGALFLTASNDGTVLLYRTHDCGKHAVLAGHEHAVTAAEFSPDGAAILTASLDGTIRLWPADPLALALERLPRAMTAGERARLARDLAGQ